MTCRCSILRSLELYETHGRTIHTQSYLLRSFVFFTGSFHPFHVLKAKSKITNAGTAAVLANCDRNGGEGTARYSTAQHNTLINNTDDQVYSNRRLRGDGQTTFFLPEVRGE